MSGKVCSNGERNSIHCKQSINHKVRAHCLFLEYPVVFILSLNLELILYRLHYTFQDADYLYMCMDLARGGELRDVISRALSENRELGRNQIACSIESTRFYIGELVEALEYLHKLNIVHMDIKPESKSVDSNT